MSIKKIMNKDFSQENSGNVLNKKDPSVSHRVKSKAYIKTLEFAAERWSQALLVESPTTIIDNKVAPSLDMVKIIDGMKLDIDSGSFFNVIGDGGFRQNDLNQIVYSFIVSTKNHSIKVIDKVKISDEKNQKLTTKSGFIGEFVWMTKAIQLMLKLGLDYENCTYLCDNKLAASTLQKALSGESVPSSSLAVQMWISKEIRGYLFNKYSINKFSLKFETIVSRAQGKPKGVKQNAMGFMCDNATNLISGANIGTSNARNSHFIINDVGAVVKVDKDKVDKNLTSRYVLAQSISEAIHFYETKMGIQVARIGYDDFEGYLRHTSRLAPTTSLTGIITSGIKMNTAEQSKLFDLINDDNVIINFKEMISSIPNVL